MLDVRFQPDRSRPEPVLRQLQTHLQALIGTGRLAAGVKLPATRELAASLQLSRATVSLTDETLVAGGWVRAHVGQGTFVAERGGARATARTAGEPARAFTLAAHVLVYPGDTVVMEQPGYFGAAMAFRAAQANLVGVGVDEEGIRTDELGRVLRARHVKLVYVTPGAQSPIGVTMSAGRHGELLALADEHQAPILEDDYDGELRYEPPAVAALKSLDSAGQVVYAGTFSKVLFPTLRVGYVVAARPLLETMVLARFHSDMATSLVAQPALAARPPDGRARAPSPARAPDLRRAFGGDARRARDGDAAGRLYAATSSRRLAGSTNPPGGLHDAATIER